MDTAAIYDHDIAVPVVHFVFIQQIVVAADIVARRNVVLDRGYVFRLVRQIQRHYVVDGIGILCVIFIAKPRAEKFVHSVHGTLVRVPFQEYRVVNHLHCRRGLFCRSNANVRSKLRSTDGNILALRRFYTGFFKDRQSNARCFCKKLLHVGCRIVHGRSVICTQRALRHENRIITRNRRFIVYGNRNRAAIIITGKGSRRGNGCRTNLFRYDLTVFNRNSRTGSNRVLRAFYGHTPHKERRSDAIVIRIVK